MGGVGAILTFLIGSKLYDVNPALPFVLFSILMVLVLILFIFRMREPQKPVPDENINILSVIRDVFTARDKSVLNVLFAIFFWFFGYSAIEAFFTLYGKEFLLVPESEAAMSLTFFSLTFVLFSIPSGFIATSIGRRKTIIGGICGLTIIFAVLIFMRQLLIIRILLFIGGIFWAMININSYPMVVESR